MKISLVLLTMNEIDGSKAFFDKIPWKAFEEAIILDGNSTDGTREFFESKGMTVISQKEKGLGSAVREAMQAVSGEYVVFFHPDGNMDCQDLLKFRLLFEQGYEFIIASRMLKGAYNEEDEHFIKPRKWANIIFARLASLLWCQNGQYRITDPVNGFRGISVGAFKRLQIDVNDCTIDYQMIIRAYKAKLNVIEFPTVEGGRVAGETKFSSIPTGMKEIKLLFNEIFK